MPGSAIIDDLQQRGLVHDSTDLDELRDRLDEGPITVYSGFDPTGRQPAHRQPGAAAAAAALPARRPPAHRAGRGRDRHDRRPRRALGGAQPARRRDPRPPTWPRIKGQLGAAARLRRRPDAGPAGRQPGLDRADRRARLPPRRRQARHREPDAGQGVGEGRVAERARHLLHRVQLHAPAGQRLLVAPRARAAASCRSAARTSGATSPPAST